jgi:predicted chitinase
MRARREPLSRVPDGVMGLRKEARMPASPIASHLLGPADSTSRPRAITANSPATRALPSDAIQPAKARSATLRDAARDAGEGSGPGRRSALVTALLARVPAADRAAAKTAIPAILDAARRVGTNDPNRIGYLLATAQTESDFGANMTEGGHSQEWFNANYGCEDGNRPGTSDGYAYRGRGYVQTTHAGRYAELSRALGLRDVVTHSRGIAELEPALVAHPERLAQPGLAAQALVVGVEQNLFTRNHAARLDATIPTGKKPGDVDFYHARGIVNGIVKDQAEAIAAHSTAYAQILAGYRHSVLDAGLK